MSDSSIIEHAVAKARVVYIGNADDLVGEIAEGALFAQRSAGLLNKVAPAALHAVIVHVMLLTMESERRFHEESDARNRQRISAGLKQAIQFFEAEFDPSTKARVIAAFQCMQKTNPPLAEWLGAITEDNE
jgi:hypothetical protein